MWFIHRTACTGYTGKRLPLLHEVAFAHLYVSNMIIHSDIPQATRMVIDLDVTFRPSAQDLYLDYPATMGRIDTVSRLGVQIDSFVDLHTVRAPSGGQHFFLPRV